MNCLLDSGILARVANRADPLFAIVGQSVRALRRHGFQLVASPQNIAEMFAVCTRPTTSRGGFGLSNPTVLGKLRIIERWFDVLPDAAPMYVLWRSLIERHEVQGVQVHDARLVAWMQHHAVEHVLTLNARDFARYPAISVISPDDAIEGRFRPIMTSPGPHDS